MPTFPFPVPSQEISINYKWSEAYSFHTGNDVEVYTFKPQQKEGLEGNPVDNLFYELFPSISNSAKRKSKEALQSALLSFCQAISNLPSKHIIGFIHAESNTQTKAVKRYATCEYSTYTFTKVLKVLEKEKYIERHAGFKGKNYSQGIATLWTPLSKLVDWLYQYQDELKLFTLNPDTELIRLKDNDKKLTCYDDDENTNAMRKRVDSANKIRVAQKWSYLPLELDNRTHSSDEQLLSPASLTAYRIFNGDFKSGGRFYCPAQKLKKAERNTIEVNDGATVELDYKSLHPRLLYNMEGLEAPKDCYFLEGFDRDLVKSASLIAFNSNSIEQAVRALMKDQGITYEEATAVLTAFRDANQPIAHYLFQGNWKYLQYLDSQLVDLILEAATRENIPVLPVHDSFIVSTKYSARLESIIYSAYKVLTGFDAIVAVEKMPDWSELEAKLFHSQKAT